MSLKSLVSSKPFKYILAVALLVILFFMVDRTALVETAKRVTVYNFGYLMLISVLLIYISAIKWGCFLESFGVSISAIRLFSLYLVGYFVNLIFPSYVGGDVIRSWYIGKRFGHHDVATSTILERYTGLLAMMILALISVAVGDVATPQIEMVTLLMGAALFTATLLALREESLSLVKRIPLLNKASHHLVKIQSGLRLATSKPKLLIHAMFLSFLFHTFTVLNTMAAGWAVGWHSADIGGLFVVLPLILIIGALPITPGGLGIQEGAFMFFLVAVGATPEQALGVGLLLRAKGYVLAFFGWFCWLWERRESGKATVG